MLFEKIVDFTNNLNGFCDAENIERTYSMTTNGFLLTFTLMALRHTILLTEFLACFLNDKF